MKSFVIIGGGLGGLFTGAILAREGKCVTVVEKNATIGGGLQSFRRFGETFDTGMHIIGGMRPGGNIRKICQYLGIMDQVEIKHVDDHCADSLYFSEDAQRYNIRSGREGFIDSLASYFPDSREDLKRYVDAIYAITDSIDIFNIRPTTNYFAAYEDDFVMAADDFIAKYISNPKLRSVVAFMNPLYGGRGQQTPAYVHAIINVLYINGGSRFKDGSVRFAELLASVITGAGGQVIKGDGVRRIAVSEKRVTHVETDSGRRLAADAYISAIHPCAMLRIIDNGAFPKSYADRLNAIPNSYSAFSIYLKLKPNTFPYINHSEYYMSRYNEIWNFGSDSKPMPVGFLFMTPPKTSNDTYATTALITSPMKFADVQQWEHTTVGQRGADYEAWKAAYAEALLQRVEEMHPGFAHCIEAMNTASPLTIRDFYASEEGCLSGYSKDCCNLVLSQLPVVTKVRNLYLTGQNNNLHGFCGVPLTAINTCEAILGHNYIINRINECAEQ